MSTPRKSELEIHKVRASAQPAQLPFVPEFATGQQLRAARELAAHGMTLVRYRFEDEHIGWGVTRISPQGLVVKYRFWYRLWQWWERERDARAEAEE